MTIDTLSLSDLRRELDSVDNALHDMVVRRAKIVQQLASGDSVEPHLSPGYEAQILRRLLSRHAGSFPKIVLVRLWREIFSAQRGTQTPFAIAVYMPKRGAGYLELAREHYGGYTTASTYTSPPQVVRAVSDGSAAIGILPVPQEDDRMAWWQTLVSDAPTTPKIVARLPFTGPGQGRGDGIEAIAIAQVSHDAMNNDRTLLVLETPGGISRASLRRVMSEAGLEECSYHGQRTVDDDVWLHLVEVNGHVSSDDGRVCGIRAESALIKRAAVIGGYVMPLSLAELS